MQPGAALRALSFKGSTGIAVGGDSKIYRSTNGGANWTPVSAPVADRQFNGVAFINASTGYIIGGIRDSVRTILKTTDGGQNWSIVEDTDGGGLNDITFIDGNLGYAVGDSATVLKTSDGGQTWLPQTVTNTLNDQRIITVSFYGANLGIIGGNGGYVKIYTNSSTPQALTLASTPIDTNGATLIGKINTDGVQAQCYFYVSADSTFPYLSTETWGATVLSDSLTFFNSNVGNLHPGVKYYYYLNVTSIAGTANGDTLSFYAQYPTYTFNSLPPDSITDTTAIFRGIVNNFHEPINLSFDYGATPGMSASIIAVPATISDTLPHSMQANLTGLLPHRQYYCRLHGITSTATYLGAPFTFYTGTPYESLLTFNATNVTDTSVTLNGSITGATETITLGFEYGVTLVPGTFVAGVPTIVSDSLGHSVSANLTGLQPYTTYYFRLRAQTPHGIFYGDMLWFFTGSTNYIFSASPATGITPYGAQLNGDIQRVAPLTNIQFEYGPTLSLGTLMPANPNSINDTLHHSVTAIVNNLQPQTVYYYRLVANLSSGQLFSMSNSFTTGVGPDDFRTLAASGVTGSSANLNGVVQHLTSSTALSFDYGTSLSFGNNISATPASVSDTFLHSVTAAITGLQVNTQYYFRMKGVAAWGTFYGDTLVFYTGANPIPNWDFQYWQEDTFLLPDGWNVISEDFERVPGHSGNYACRVSNGAIALTGMFSTRGDGFFGGSYFHARPDSLSAWINYNLIPGDTGMMLVIMYNSTDPGICTQFIPIYGNSGGTFTRFSAALDYNSANMPDSIVVGFFCGLPDHAVPHPADYIIFDDIAPVPATANIYNHDLENWFNYPLKTLTGWNYLRHALINPGNMSGSATVLQNYYSQPSDYAVELKNVRAFGQFKMGEINNNNGGVGDKSGGFPVYTRHQTLNGFYKWLPDNGDTMSIDLVMLKNGQVIGDGRINQAAAVTQFTPFTIPVNYYQTNIVPDTALINIRACAMSCLGESRLIVDKLSFDGFSDVPQDFSFSESPVGLLRAYPNPTNGRLNVVLDGELSGPVLYSVYDLNGRGLLTQIGVTVSDKRSTVEIDVSGLSSGVYIVVATVNQFQARLKFTLVK
jgi:phosphodiesterase/alkaline phosphatase D-like protein